MKKTPDNFIWPLTKKKKNKILDKNNYTNAIFKKKIIQIPT